MTPKPGRRVAAPGPEPVLETKPGKLRWFVGWILFPGAIAGSFFAGGVHLGARFPEFWLVRLVAYFAD